MYNMLDSASALQRFKTRNGYRMTGNVNTSAYIIATKMKRILNNEFTQDHFDRFLIEQQYAATSNVNRGDKINQFITRIDKIPQSAIIKLYEAYVIDGIMALVNSLSRPMKYLQSLGRNGRVETV
jgi:hypothetical protein